MSIEDKATIALLVVLGILAAVVGGKITYQHYFQDKIDNCVVDNLNAMRVENPIAFKYTTIADLPQVRKQCEDIVNGN